MKQINLIVAALLGCLLVLSSCTSHTEQAMPTTINGQVRTYGTTEQAEHPPILLQLVHGGASGAIGGGRSYSVLDETWSDQYGYFSLNASLFANEEYYLMADYNSVKRNKGYIVPATTPYERDRITRIGGTINQN